jgi:hypothetical protein
MFLAGVLQPPLVLLKQRIEKETCGIWVERKKKPKKNRWRK